MWRNFIRDLWTAKYYLLFEYSLPILLSSPCEEKACAPMYEIFLHFLYIQCPFKGGVMRFPLYINISASDTPYSFHKGKKKIEWFFSPSELSVTFFFFLSARSPLWWLYGLCTAVELNTIGIMQSCGFFRIAEVFFPKKNF